MSNPLESDFFVFFAVVLGLFCVILIAKGILGPRATRAPRAAKPPQELRGWQKPVLAVCLALALISVLLLLLSPGYALYVVISGNEPDSFGFTLLMLIACSDLVAMALLAILSWRRIVSWFMTKPNTPTERLNWVGIGLFGLGSAAMPAFGPDIPESLRWTSIILLVAGVLIIGVAYILERRGTASQRSGKV
jgi:hypothetical protein